MSTTRAQLRQAIDVQLRTVHGSPTLTRTATGGTTSTIVDTTAVETENYWSNYWAYVSDSTDELAPEGEEALVTAFSARTHTFTLAPALSAAVGSGDTYELRRYWSAASIHAAIDHALEEAASQFPADAEDETVVIKEDTYDYTVPSGVDYIYAIRQLHHEVVYDSTATSGGATTLTDTEQSWDTNELAAFEVAIYAGAGAGQYRTIASNTADTITVSVAWVTNPDSTSKYVVKDLTDLPVTTARLTNYEVVGSTIHLRSLQEEGQRLRITYRPSHVTLATDAATTSLPKTYVVLRAVQELCLMTPATMSEGEVKTALALHDRLEPQLLRYLQMNKKDMRPTTWRNRGSLGIRSRWDSAGTREIGTRRNE